LASGIVILIRQPAEKDLMRFFGFYPQNDAHDFVVEILWNAGDFCLVIHRAE